MSLVRCRREASPIHSRRSRAGNYLRRLRNLPHRPPPLKMMRPMLLPPETIVTDRLVLRLPKPSDDEAVFAYASDPEVTRYMDWARHTDIRDAEQHRQEILQKWKSGEEFTWRITMKPSDDPIGAIACRVRGHSVGLGFVVARDHWGNGYATEATRAIMAWAVSKETIYRVWATCDIGNLASARVLEKAGMTKEGVLRCRTRRPNLGSDVPHDDVVYSWVRVSDSRQ